ncbi:hypothetical protein [Pseudomonas sp. Irchel 3E20]|uniref:hypothetical protein n=1 Tax=Pseudomonas sp. Irchel 3E20 TaxID=2008983 RepID=UPI000BA3C088|nr:hypothetical protein [Pseudomonas sp. Irchel 3E20]
MVDVPRLLRREQGFLMTKKSKKKVKKRAPSSRQRIAKLEKRVAEINALMPSGTTRQQGMYARELRELLEQIRIEKVHVLSQYSQVGVFKLSGSYGSGKR